MQLPISIQAKKYFLKWFIRYFDIHSDDINWFLEDLLEDEQALLNIHFVRNIEHCPKGVIISTQESNNTSFTFFKGAIQTEDVYTAYHELHLYYEEAFYVQINFPECESHPLYKCVLEEEKIQTEKDSQYANDLLQFLLVKGKKQYFEEKIDEALQKGDKQSFFYYSTKLKALLNDSIK
ncbi:YpiB family protein [Pseudogracilibacillus sp. SE30717A]|uniref:YpiB family protein n=1 Tax=Pseudogracilibacillus sp. SE30717A TaxID=3098293 RepID=UPI00300DD270